MSNKSSLYTPFARKYRPSNFSELLGQGVLTKTLSYCISENRLAQAYLLTGIRGVGKTSAARIVAKTINCESPIKTANNVSSCGICKNCQAFSNNSHPDVIEIDAASHTSVDDIRRVIESCEYMPLLGRYKLFIIDEVHMLSKNAFNALLKIIEEPPQHVIFIFATTEVQKIPLTVISRCQRFDLRRLSFQEILQLLSNIAKKENLQIEDDALKIIAIKSEGSARDAAAILDQAASYVHNSIESDHITADLVARMLGLVQISAVLRIVQLIVANDPTNAIKMLENIYANSSNLEYFISAIADFIAEITKEKIINGYHNPLYLSYSKEIADLLIGLSLSRLSILWQIFSNAVHEMKSSHNELLLAEMTIIKAIHSCNMPSVEEILSAEESIGSVPESSRKIAKIIVSNKNIVGKESDIFDFLKYCHKQNEIDVYYALLNDVEVISFDSNKLELGGNLASSLNDKIKLLLSNWSGRDYKVNIARQNEVTSLKQKMVEKAKLSEDFNIIKNNFPSANISDIILGNR